MRTQLHIGEIAQLLGVTPKTIRHYQKVGLLADPARTGALLLALEDGFRLHRLIDPETTPADSFVRALSDLQQAIGLSSS